MPSNPKDDAKGDAAEVVKSLPPEVMKRVDALSTIQGKYKEEFAKFIEEKKALEAKYAAIYSELYKQRADVVNGVVDPAEAGDKSKGIPRFWLQAMSNQRRISPFIEEADEEALSALTDITMEYLEGFNGFKLLFHFAPNPYFTNEVLTKTFNIPDMLASSRGTGAIESLPGCKIDWKEGKNLVEKEVKKTTKKKGKKVTTTKMEKLDSFFSFFDTPDVEAEPETMEQAFELQQEIQGDIDIGTALKEKVLPRAVDWFTGEAAEDDSDDEDDEDDEDDYDDEDDEDDEDEDEDDAPRRKARGRGRKPADDDDEEDEDDDEDEEDQAAQRAALATAFKKSVKVKGDAKDGEDKGKGAGNEKAPECKQQ